MNRKQLLTGFQLDHEAVCNHKVEPRFSQRDAFVSHRNGNLPSEADRSQLELHAQRFFVQRFEQSWAQRAMDLQCCIDHDARELVQLPIWFWVICARAAHVLRIGLLPTRLRRISLS